VDLDQYQQRARLTDHTAGTVDAPADKQVVVALLGLAGEVGTLATAYKKLLRDGAGYELYREHVKEELGDILWYLSTVGDKYGLSLSEIADSNLEKISGRWLARESTAPLFGFLDDEDRPDEQLPRQFVILFREEGEGARRRLVLTSSGHACGDPLTDNAYFEDGYRFHDVFHLAYAAVLGWSPVTRKLLNCKRRSRSEVDEIEDGGRAGVIEEGIAAFVFDYARKHRLLENVMRVDFETLKAVKDLTAHLEVRVRSWHDWEQAILTGYDVFRQVSRKRGGLVVGDLNMRTLQYRAEE
jgi:NTP pyrophosphatase (non-canonical NTP hydrolase)